MKNITFIGPINNKYPYAGDTMKNMEIYNYFKQRKDINLKYINTSCWHNGEFFKIIKVLLQIIFVIIVDRKRLICLSLNSDSLYKIINLCYCFKRKRIWIFVIGGELINRIYRKQYKQKYFSIPDKIYVEGLSMLSLAQKMNMYNVFHLPNFKSVNKKTEQLSYSKTDSKLDDKPIKFVFLSRIMAEKGVTLIFNAIKLLNQKKLNDKFTVTFFGQIDNKYKMFFENELLIYNNAEYGGILNFSSIEGYKTLSTFDVMLFPTMWKGEGFPGIIIDAYVAGLPIIASDWNMNSEVIKDGVNGFLINPITAENLVTKMELFINNKDLIVKLGKESTALASRYDTEELLNKIFEK